MNSPRVSVIIPCFNSEAFLEPTLTSVRMQTFDRWEVVLVDDGSTDHGIEAARRMMPVSKLRVFQQTHQGPAAARNRGVRESQAEFIAFLDSDDLFKPHKLAAQIDWLDSHPEHGLVAGFHDYCTESGGPCPGGFFGFDQRPPLEGLLDAHVFAAPCVVMRREVFLRAGGFREEWASGEDWEFWVRLLHGGIGLGMVPDVVCTVRRRRASASRDYRRGLQDKLSIIDHLARLVGPVSMTAERTTQLRRMVWEGAIGGALHAGCVEEAINYARELKEHLPEALFDRRFFARLIEVLNYQCSGIAQEDSDSLSRWEEHLGLFAQAVQAQPTCVSIALSRFEAREGNITSATRRLRRLGFGREPLKAWVEVIRQATSQAISSRLARLS